MGYCLSESGMDAVFRELSAGYILYAPKVFPGGNTYSGTDCIRYGEITHVRDIETGQKSDFSFKEVLLPLSQTLFYFTEDDIKEPELPQRDALIFLRSCDLHALKRLDEIYLYNEFSDIYYQRLREKCRFVLIGCRKAYDSCFCVDMGTNISEGWDAAFESKDGRYYMDSNLPALTQLLEKHAEEKVDYIPSYVTETQTKVSIPDDLSIDIAKASMWREYDDRCINCGRCTLACPTCTCFTMQDIFYQDNGKAGERRRVQASCMVDGFTDTAGGGSYRRKNGDRVRFRALHKVYDFKKRFGYHMCVGCGRCEDICPEYITLTHIISKLSAALEEVRTDG